MNKEFKLLKACKNDFAYNYSDIADILGYSKPYIWQLAHKKRRLSYENAVLISTVFNMTPDELFYSDFINNTEVMEKINFIKQKCREFEKERRKKRKRVRVSK